MQKFREYRGESGCLTMCLIVLLLNVTVGFFAVHSIINFLGEEVSLYIEFGLSVLFGGYAIILFILIKLFT